MKNWFGLGSFCVLLVMGVLVFVTAQHMHQAQTNLQTLNRQIAQERDNLRVLQAEWTYLNNPDRLEKLATTLFGLEPLDGKQYVALAGMPTMAAMDEIALAAATPANGIVTEDAVTVAETVITPVPVAIAMPPAIQASLTLAGDAE